MQGISSRMASKPRLLPPLKKRNPKKLETRNSVDSSVDSEELERVVSPHPIFENLGPNRRPSMYVAQMKPQLTKLIGGLKPVADDLGPDMIGQIHAKVMREVNNLLTDLEIPPEVTEETESIPENEPEPEIGQVSH